MKKTITAMTRPSGGVTGAIGVLSVEALAETPGRPLHKGPRARVHGGHRGNATSKNLKTSTKPVPAKITLGSFINKNTFEALMDDHTTTTHDVTCLADIPPVSGRAALAVTTTAKAPAPATTPSSVLGTSLTAADAVMAPAPSLATSPACHATRHDHNTTGQSSSSTRPTVANLRQHATTKASATPNEN